ncbi:MAG: hypothetical protein JST00_30790 [Deltaproteobacteria bacterium]|nr:hypothetical protein [Deltaproteobacteria bacterium]
MLRTSWFAAAALGGALLSSCGVTPNISVIVLAPGEKAADVQGDPVKTRRGSHEAYAGMKPGYFVVRNLDDWHAAWPEGKAPGMPATLDTTRQMLLLGVPERKDTARVELKRVVETGGIIHVFAKETRFGENCPQKAEVTPLDAVVVPRIDKPVRFYVEDDRAESCGKPPEASIQCRVGEGKTWGQKLAAQPGETIECEMSAEARGKFALVDSVLTLADLPGGSTAKLTYTKGAARGTFGIDVFGTYSVRAEAADDSGRRTHALATIEVKPPKSKDIIVQLVWSNFDVGDDPDTFPRLSLKAIETGPNGQRQVCSSDDEVPLTCDVKKKSAYTHMRLRASDKKTPLELTYVDERVDKGPLVCVHVYYDGARTFETCDRNARKAGELWNVGAVDMTTGRIGEAAPPLADEAGEDGGAPKPPATKPKPAGPKPKR